MSEPSPTGHPDLHPSFAAMATATAALAKASGSDVLVYQTGVTPEGCALLHNAIDARASKRENVCLFLQTAGGSADSAYQMAKKIRSSYPNGKITLIVDAYWLCL